jgi:hypothetical protein
MAKATRVRYSGTAPFIDDAQANRVQALGSSSRLTTDDVKELGTLNIVEVVDDVPQVDVSIDANENGTNEIIGLLANSGYGCQVVATPVSGSANSIGSTTITIQPGRYYSKTGHSTIFGGATLTMSGSTAQQVYLTNAISTASDASKVGVAASGSAPAGSIILANVTPNAGVVNQSNIVDMRPFQSISANTFELSSSDMFVPIVQSGDGLNGQVARTMYMENVYVNSIDLSYATSGVATASFKAETDNKRWFLNSASQMIVDEFSSTGATTVTLTQTPFQLANGNYTLKLTKNGTKLVEGTDYTVSAKVVTFTSAPTSGDLIKVRYVTSGNVGKFFSPVPNPATPHPTLAGGLRQGNIEIYLTDQNGVADTNYFTRIQSARISVPLQREALAQLGTLFPYNRPLSLPVNVSVTLEMTDSDLEAYARFAGYSNLASANEIALSDLVKNKGVLIKIYRESDVVRAKLPAGHPNKFAIKSIYVPLLIPQSESWDVKVDSDATQSFDFQAHQIVFDDSFGQ